MTSIHRPLRVLVGALFVLTLMVAGSVRGAPAQGIIYVRHDAVGNNDGSSWTDAYTDLQDALGTAQSGDEIWVAQGVYYPAPNAIDRTATFELVDGVALYGGFAGSENEREERDWEANVTVLSGDLDRNDTIDENNVVTDTVGILGRNACHVVTADGVGDMTVIDGFVVTAGLADGVGHAYGGGVYSSDSNPMLTNVTFSGNEADFGAGVSSSHSNPTLTNVTFSANKANYNGGGMYNDHSSPTLTSVTFTVNEAWRGYGMYNSSSNPKLTNVAFTRHHGTAMYNWKSNPTLSHVLFSENEAWGAGGMRNEESSPTLNDVVFSSNRATANGAGMYNTTDSSPTLTDVTFIGNEADRNGAGMYNTTDSSPTLTDVTFIDNYAGYRGGGMYNEYESSPTLTDVTFTGNQATSNGGGMYNLTESNPTLAEVNFSENKSEQYGGGMYNSRSTPRLADVTFRENDADEGGGMYNTRSSPTLTNVTFSGNSAQTVGGGMYNWVNSDPTLTNVAFIGNQATSDGGGMYNLQSSPTLTHTTFTGNQAGHGGGMYNLDSSPTLINAILTGNQAARGGGMYSYRRFGASQPVLTNVTFGANKAESMGGAIYTDYSSLILTNCILWGNAASIGPQIYNEGTGARHVTYSTIEGSCPPKTTCGPGMIYIDPLFVAPVPVEQAPTTDGNYRLRAGSPAVDAGTNDEVTLDTDLDGNPRIVDGTSDGTAVVDMGAYELQVYVLTINERGGGIVVSTPGLVDCGDVCADKFAASAVVTLTGTPEPGWSFADWTGDVESTDNPLELTIEGDTHITATFTQDEYTLEVDVVGEGDVDVDPDQDTYFYGDTVKLTATADAGWTFDGWTGDQVSTDNPLELTIQDDTAITATFTRDEYSLDVTVVGEGGVEVEPDQDVYHYGDVVTLTATADPGWTFRGWTGDRVSTDSPLVLTIQDNTSVTATFTRDEYTLDVSIVGEGDAEVDPDQDTYHYDDVVTLTATADPGWTFVAWSGDIESTDNPLELTIHSDTELTATFTQDEYGLDLTIVGQGDVEVEPEQDTYIYRDVVTLTATADPGWTFAAWSGAVESADNPLALTIQDNTVVTATFNQDEYTLEVDIVGEGSVEVEQDQDTYHYGDIITLIAAPDAGWTFVGWAGDVESRENPLEFVVEGDTAITATFTKEEYTLDIAIVGQGTVTKVPEQAVYHYGDGVTLTATADPGWTFHSWSGDIISTDNPLELTIQYDTAITATFTQDEYSLDVTVVGEGDVEMEPDQDLYLYGKVVTLTATADPGWTFMAWSRNPTTTTNPLALTVNESTMVTATFQQMRPVGGATVPHPISGVTL